MNENFNRFLESQKRFQKMFQNPTMDKIQKNHKRMEQIANPEWLRQVNTTQNRFAQMNFDSYINQLNQMTIQPMAFINQNQTMFNQIQTIQNELKRWLPDLTSFYPEAEEITEEETYEFQNNYSELLDRLDSLKAHTLTDEQRSDMAESLEVFLKVLNNPPEVKDAEENTVQHQDNRESNNTDQSDQNDGYFVFDFFADMKHRLFDPSWHNEQLTEMIVGKFYEKVFVLVMAVKTDQLDIVLFGIAILILLSLLPNKKN